MDSDGSRTAFRLSTTCLSWTLFFRAAAEALVSRVATLKLKMAWSGVRLTSPTPEVTRTLAVSRSSGD
jgi:hypothetical protein